MILPEVCEITRERTTAHVKKWRKDRQKSRTRGGNKKIQCKKCKVYYTKDTIHVLKYGIRKYNFCLKCWSTHKCVGSYKEKGWR